MTQHIIENEYFEWLSDMVCGDRYAKEISYRRLLIQLHSTEFRYSILMDKNRAADGIELRYRFTLDAYGESRPYLDYLEGPCSVLEMMVALAISCEEIMDDPRKGDRTTQWFWEMIVNLGLGSMTDENFDKLYVDEVLNRFLDRNYSPNGRGGLFVLRHCDEDLRDVEIWHQLCWHLNEING